jgi:lambda family phage portal protein
MNPIEQLLAAIAPRAALRRETARLQLEEMRKYSAAGRGRRTDSWMVQRGSADAISAMGFADIRDRAREQIRNNPWARKAILVWADNLIGEGWSFKAKGGRRNGRRGRDVTQLMQAWMADPLQCDYYGKANFDGLMAQVVQAWKGSGEVLIRARTPSSATMRRLGLRVPLQLQVMEADWIDESHDTPGGESGSYTKRGIVYDAEDKASHYWLYNYHPGESAHRVTSVLSNTVPAGQIIHLFTAERPGMSRGVSCLAPVLLRLRDLQDLMDSRLLKEKVAACLAVAIVDMDGMGNQKSTIGTKIEPGGIVTLGPGQDIRTISPPATNELPQQIKVYLLEVAAGIGITYEELTGDYTGGSFTQGRMGWIGFQRRLKAETWQTLEPTVFRRVWQWAATAMSVVGTNTDGLVGDWTPPKRELFDPQSEITSIRDRIRSGLLPPQEAIRAEGYEPEDVILLWQEWMVLMDEAGITLDIDPRKVSAAGLTQGRPAGTALPPTGAPPLQMVPAPAAGASAGNTP